MNQVINTKKSPGLDISLLLFFSISLLLIVFELTALKFIWEISSLSRVVNTLLLLGLFIYFFLKILSSNLNRLVWVFYVFPGLMILFSYLFNVSINIINDLSNFTSIALLLPWLMYLSVPFMMKDEILRLELIPKFYFYTIVLIVSLGLVEYLLILLGLSEFKLIDTPYGKHLVGNFSILFALDDETPAFQFYGAIMEAGNLAQLILPAIIFSIIYKKWFFCIILLTAIVLTRSLGGYLGLLQVFIFLPLLLKNEPGKKLLNKSLIYSFLYYLGLLIIFLFLVEFFWETYQQKIYAQNVGTLGQSGVRSNNVLGVMSNLVEIILTYPIGYDFKAELTKENLYFGSNFGLAVALYSGGLPGFIGYIIIILTTGFTALRTLFEKNLTKNNLFFSLSILVILPFLFQRSSLLEHATLIFFFMPFVVQCLKNKSYS